MTFFLTSGKWFVTLFVEIQLVRPFAFLKIMLYICTVQLRFDTLIELK